MALYKIVEEEATLHLSKGNNKIGKGVWSFSTLPGNKDHLIYIGKGGEKRLLTDIPGTCSKYCDGCAHDGACYAWRDAKLHHNVVIKAWGDNTLLLRNGRPWDELETFIAKKNRRAKKILDQSVRNIAEAREKAVIKIFRIHVSGEIENIDELRHWDAIASAHPETTFAMYTKNFDALGAYLDEKKGVSPENLIINASEWHGVAANFINKYSAKYPGAFNVFEYDDHNKKDCDLPVEEKVRLETLPHCAAVGRDGKHQKFPNGDPITCDKCMHCYRKHGNRIAVWSH